MARKKKNDEELGKALETVCKMLLVEHEAQKLAKELVEMGRCPINIICDYEYNSRTMAGCIDCWRKSTHRIVY